MPTPANGIRKNESIRSLWDNEYCVSRAIPSTTRSQPSKALILFEALVNFERLTPVLDAGCGNGRNAIYLAKKGCEVYAVDVSQAAIALAHARLSHAGVETSVHLREFWLHGQWPFEDASFAFVLDSYVSCHLIDGEERATYHRELQRVLRPSGLIFSSAFCVDDEYYSDFASNGNRVVCDPSNGIKKYLYTEDEFIDSICNACRLLYYVKFQFSDDVHRHPYRRSILTLIAEK